jgi:hypothetical protein
METVFNVVEASVVDICYSIRRAGGFENRETVKL